MNFPDVEKVEWLNKVQTHLVSSFETTALVFPPSLLASTHICLLGLSPSWCVDLCLLVCYTNSLCRIYVIDSTVAAATTSHKKATPPLAEQPHCLLQRRGRSPGSPLNISISLLTSSQERGGAAQSKIKKRTVGICPSLTFAILDSREQCHYYKDRQRKVLTLTTTTRFKLCKVRQSWDLRSVPGGGGHQILRLFGFHPE